MYVRAYYGQARLCQLLPLVAPLGELLDAQADRAAPLAASLAAALTDLE